MPDIATDPSTHSPYVMSSGDDSLYVVDAQSRTATIKVGKSPGFVAVDENTQTAYVTRGNTVSSVDIASGSITGTIAVGNDPEGIEVDPSTRTVYVANVSRRHGFGDRRRLTATIKVGNSPGKMGVDPSSHLLFVSNRGKGGAGERFSVKSDLAWLRTLRADNCAISLSALWTADPAIRHVVAGDIPRRSRSAHRRSGIVAPPVPRRCSPFRAVPGKQTAASPSSDRLGERTSKNVRKYFAADSVSFAGVPGWP